MVIGDAVKGIELYFGLCLDRQDHHEILQAAREGRIHWSNDRDDYVDITRSYISRISATHITINGIEMTHSQYHHMRSTRR